MWMDYSTLRIIPFLKFWGGDDSSKVGSRDVHLALPPVWIMLVDDLNDVARFELQPCFFAWDEVILGRVVVKLSPHVRLLSNTEQLHTQRWLRGHDLLCWELGKTFWNMCIAVNMVFAMIYSTAVSSIW